MDTAIRKLDLTEADLLGHDPNTLRCNQCGGAFCGMRVGRIFNGKPIIMCGRREDVQEILSFLGRR